MSKHILLDPIPLKIKVLKKTDLKTVSESRIREVEKLINYGPIRKFNYNNPIETLKNKTVALMG